MRRVGLVVGLEVPQVDAGVGRDGGHAEVGCDGEEGEG